MTGRSGWRRSERLCLGKISSLRQARPTGANTCFGRLPDTLADKLLPALLDWRAEPVAAAIDNLNRAERLGWIESVEVWTEVRRLRNRMIHEVVRDPAELASALTAAHAAVPLLTAAADAMASRVMADPTDASADRRG